MGFMRAGKILHIDLTNEKISHEPTNAYTERFYGGHGINLKILFDRVGPDVDPLSPENLFILGTGPFTGTMIPGTGRTSVAAKSPQSGLMGRSNIGGYWAPELKYAGYDNLIVTGKADNPVYIAIHNDKVELRDAAAFWGMDTYQTQTAIRKELGDPEAQIMCIGPGGENLVKYATIITRLGNGAGRTGMGCVMGSKNLKAIAVRGTKGVKIAEPDRFMELCMETNRILNSDDGYGEIINRKERKSYADIGGSGNNVLGNFLTTSWPEETVLEEGLDALWADYGTQLIGCFNCPVRCMEYYVVPEIGPSVLSCTIYSEMGRGIENKDAMLWFEMSSYCQKYGIDPTSAAGMISWATELYEKGIISERDTDGVSMTVGNREARFGILEKIVKREGFGDILAGSVDEAVNKMGDESAYYMMHVKGIHALHDNFVNHRDLAIALATGNRGDWIQGHWNNQPFDTILEGLPEVEKRWASSIIEEALGKYGLNQSDVTVDAYECKAALMAFHRKLVSVSDMLLNCKWHSTWTLCKAMGIENQARLLSAGEGVDHSVEELFEAAERIHALERAYNAREGLTRQDDKLPKRFFEKPILGYRPDDILDPEKFEKMKDEYYEAMRWDVKTGVPTSQTLKLLGLPDVAEDLENRRMISNA